MTPEMQPNRPEWSESFYVGKIGRGLDLLKGVTLKDMLSMMDQAGIQLGQANVQTGMPNQQQGA